MKQPGFLILLFIAIWQLNATKATAQDQDPYHCDSLKVTCFDENKIKIRFFNVPKTCAPTCTFCAAIAKQDWLEVKNQLNKEVKTVSLSAEKLPDLRTWLLAHRMVNFVLSPDPVALPKQNATMQIGFQVPHMTFTWAATFQLKPARKAKPAYWKFTAFEEDSRIYSRLNELGANLQTHLRSDSLKMPPPLLPDQNYLASWFGTRNLPLAEYANLEKQIQNHPREVVKTFIEKKDGIGLALMMAHQNLAIRYLALQGIITIQDKNCLPYLLRVAEVTIQPVEPSPELRILYSNYCEKLVSAIGILSNCSFNRCPFAHYGPQYYLRLGLPTWERRIEHRNGQGIGSYATIL